MYILNGAPVNIHAEQTINGVTYANLTDAELRTALGVEEIAEPEAPADYTPETYFRQETGDAPYVVYTRKDQAVIDRDAQVRLNAESLAYLASTDWYVVRELENGAAIPDDVKAKRQAARDAIVVVVDVMPAAEPVAAPAADPAPAEPVATDAVPADTEAAPAA